MIALLVSLSFAQAPVPESVPARAAAFVERYRESGDGAYLVKAEAILHDSTDRDARRLKILLATFRHEFPLVEREARKVLEENPRDFAAAALLGDALMELGRYAEAGPVYERLLTRRANSEAYSRVAWHRFVTGRGAEALAWIRLAVAAGSATAERQAWLQTELAEMAYKLGSLDDAQMAIREALRLAPGSHRAHAVHARMHWDTDPAKARDSMAHALRIMPLPEYAAELALHDPESSERHWKYAAGIEKIRAAQGEKANRVLAILYADAERNLDCALQLVEAEYEVRDDVYSHDARAWVLHKLGRNAEAKIWMQKAMAQGTPEPSFARHAAAIADAAGTQ